MRAAHDPVLNDVDAIVREVREVLPALESRSANAISWPDIPRGEARTRAKLIGSGRLIRAEGAEALPSTLEFELRLDEHDQHGHLLVRGGAPLDGEWKIITADRLGDRDGAFTYTFRLAAPDHRLYYLSVISVKYGVGSLRFRSFEGYLIFPGKDGTLSARPLLYAIDFGYHWPVPPLHESRLASLEADSARLTEQAANLARRIDTLRASDVPADQRARRRDDLAEWDARRLEAIRARKPLADNMAAALEKIYRLRADIAGDWLAFRRSNPYRWLADEARQRTAARLNAAETMTERWRTAFDAVGGAERPSLREARAALERALLAEPGPAQ